MTRTPTDTAASYEANPRDQAAIAWTRFLVALHLLATGLATWMAPHGFPLAHPRFWLHTAGPALFACACVGLLWRPRWAASALAGFWFTAAATFVALYAGEALPFALLAFLLAVLMAASAIRHGVHPALLVGLLGVLPPSLLRAPPPSTHPTQATLAGDPSSHLLSLDVGTLSLVIDPRMRRDDMSAHRFQTLFGPTPPPSNSKVFTEDLPLGRRIHARTVVERPEYAHLHTYTELLVEGHTTLELVFSPCPDTPIEPEPADYPWGRPLRFAIVDADRTFRVVEASSGEKGPYTDLCVGELPTAAPLTIELRDAGHPQATIRLLDYAKQLSTELSPAAGHGMPQNALTFKRESDAPDAPVWLHISLASTAIGLGWDSVAIAPGTYDARIEITAPGP